MSGSGAASRPALPIPRPGRHLPPPSAYDAVTNRGPALLPRVLLLAVVVLTALLPAPAQAAPTTEPERPALEERLVQDWRWRELVLPNDAETLESIGLDHVGQLTAIVDGRLFRYQNGWQAVAAGAGPAPLTTAVPGRGGFVAAGHAGLTFIDAEGGARPILADGGRRPQSTVLLPREDGSVYALDGRELLVILDGDVVAQRPAPAERFFVASSEDAHGRMVVCADDELWLESDDGSWQPIPAGELADPLSRRYGMVRQGDDVLFVPSRQMAAAPVLRWDGTRLSREGQAIQGGESTLVEGRVLVTDWVDGLSVQQDDGSWRQLSVPTRIGERLISVLTLGDDRLLVVNGLGRPWICDLTSRRWQLHVPPIAGSRSVNALSRARDGGLWVGTGSGLLRFSDGRFELVDDAPIQMEQITGVLEDSRGRVWVTSGSSFPGAVVGEAGRWRHIEEPFGGSNVHQVRETADGSVWFLLLGPLSATAPVSTPVGGVVAHHPDGSWSRWGVADGLPHGRCYDLAELPDGRMVVACLDGLALLDGGRWQPWAGFDGPARSLLVAADGALWASRGLNYEGVARWHEGHWTDVDPWLSGLFVGAMAQGPEASVWISSPSGLFRHDDAGLHPAGAEASRPVRSFWPILAEADGVWLGGLERGLVRFRPDDPDPPQVLDLRIEPTSAGWFVRWTTVDPDERTEHGDLRHRGRVDAGPWVEFDEEHATELSGLQPGQHTFELMVLDRWGNRTIASTEPFEVLPPWWQRRSTWALTVLSLIALAAATKALTSWRREARRARQRVARHELHFRQVVNQVGALFARFDGDGRQLWADDSFARLLGEATLDEIPDALDEPEEAESFRRMIYTARYSETPGAVEISLVDSSGLRRWFLANLVIRPDAEEAQRGFDLAALDVTERRMTDQRGEQLTAWRRQTERMEAVGHLAAGIAHDFNNLLTAILGNRSLIEHRLRTLGWVDESVQDYVEAIGEAGEKAAALTQRLLHFSRQGQATPQSVAVSEALTSLERVLRRLVREDVTLSWDVAPDLPAIWIDPSEFEQVVLNLVVNAQDAIPGRGSIEVRMQQLSTAELCLHVSDDGVGMDASTQQRIFDPFFTTKDLGSGTGLGLATVQRIVADAGGTVTVESRQGEGTTFSVILPVARSAASTKRTARAVPGGSEAVVICEDDLVVRELVRGMLTQRGYEALAAASTDQALDWIATRDDIRLLVTDVIMPGCSGPELAQAARDCRPGLPILYVSGYPAHLIGGDLVEDDLLYKPFTEIELAERVRHAIDSRASPGALAQT